VSQIPQTPLFLFLPELTPQKMETVSCGFYGTESEQCEELKESAPTSFQP